MMTKNIKNKGFTLIELLAVIVILAVIALIAVPQILNILNKARKSAAEDSTSGIIKSVENYVTSFMLQNNGRFPDIDVVFNCDGNNCHLFTDLEDYNLDNLEELDFKGTKPTRGLITISNSGKNIFATNLEVNNFVCNSVNNTVGCSIAEDIKYFQTPEVVYFNPETGEKCTDYSEEINSVTGNTNGCMKWYVYSENEKLGTVDMILDHNTTATIAWNSTNDNSKMKEIIVQLASDTKTWINNLNARLITADEISKIVNKDDFNSKTSNLNKWFYFHDLTSNVETGQGDKCKDLTGGCKYAWLYDRTRNNCKETYGCANNSIGIDTYGYWTSTPVVDESYRAWIVSWHGHLGVWYSSVGYTMYHGIRPVITVNKSDLGL